VPYYACAPSGGTLSVLGSAVTQLVSFVRATFPVWFYESGLPVGASWSVTLVGTTGFAGEVSNNSTTPSVGFELPPGSTASYTVSTTARYLPNPPSGTLRTPTPGSSFAEQVAFSPFAPPGPSIAWFHVTPGALAVGGVATFQVVVRNGSPPLSYYYLGLPAGCGSRNLANLTCTPTSLGRSTVMVIVSDSIGRTAEANATISVGPASGSTASQLFGLPAPGGEALLAGAAVIAVACLAVWWLRRRHAPSREVPEPPEPPTD
jgi:hypothetical protein